MWQFDPHAVVPPVPVAPLAYSLPGAAKPGVLTAIAVLDIVVACLSGLFSLIFAFETAGLWFASRVFAAMATASATTIPAATAPMNLLTPAQVNQIVARVQSTTGNGLNAAQLASLRSQLSAPNQLIAPGTAWSPIRYANARRRGNAVIQFSGGMLVLGPQGQVLSSGTVMPRLRVNGTAAAIVIGEELLSVLLAIYLFVIGILMFRPSRRMPGLHRVYAVIKLVLALTGAAGIAWMGYEFVSGIGPVTASVPGFLIFALIIAIIGCAYPVGLLIALRAGTVRNYFNTVVGG